jgi:putative transposase
MARKTRFNLPGVPQHVVQRGNNREPCFYAVDDYFRYLDDLHGAAFKNQVAIHAYVLMSNHVHLLATPGQAYSISHMMQDLGRKYVRYINRTYRRPVRCGRDAIKRVWWTVRPIYSPACDISR